MIAPLDQLRQDYPQALIDGGELAEGAWLRVEARDFSWRRSRMSSMEAAVEAARLVLEQLHGA